MMKKKTAIWMKALPTWNGKACLYKLEPALPTKFHGYADYVIVVTRDSEVEIFAAFKDGTVNASTIGGTSKRIAHIGYGSHWGALEQLGYVPQFHKSADADSYSNIEHYFQSKRESEPQLEPEPEPEPAGRKIKWREWL